MSEILLVCFCVGAPSELKCSDSNLSITGGKFTLSDEYNDGSILRYQCPEGYYPYPVKKRKCSRGKWNPVPSRKPAECKKITCPNPRVLENGDVEPYQTLYYVNDTTSYTCHSDYSLRGSSTRICQLNGKWNGSTPICSRDTDHCPDPGTPPGASRTGHIFDIDDTVSYRCDNKLKLLGSRERVCQDDGTWSGQEPECYADFTYDTPEEVAQAFGGTLKNTLTTLEDKGQAVKKIRLEQKGKLNIYIALDASDSIDEEDFEDAKQIIIKLIDNIRYYEVFPNYDILIFATHVTKIVNITDNYGKEKDEDKKLHETIQQLKSFKYDAKGDKSGTNIARAYQDILESISLVKAMNNTLFKETQHVIIMFTDGIANMGGDPTHKINEIKQIVYDGEETTREPYLDLYVFGVGEDAEEVRENVNEWVTKRDKEKHIFLLEDMKNMQETLDEMIDESTSVGLCGLFKTYDKKHENYDHTAYPWMTKFSFNRDGKFSNCLGSLVTPTFILTAAHCFKFDDEPGSIHFEIPTNVKAKNILPHPKYKLKDKVSEGISEYYVYDVALIELDRPVKVSVDMRPICIPCTKETSGALRLTGGGVTCQKHKDTLLNKELEDAFFMASKPIENDNNKKVHPKQEVQIKLKKKTGQCIDEVKTSLNISAETARDYITGNFLCTGGTEKKHVDKISCKGDSGGATFMQQTYRAIQVGVVSWGLKDVCEVEKPVNTRDFHVDLFNPEVQKFLKEYLGDETRKFNVALHFL
ncbi:complement factor B-like [Astyanax mexicanus]|uniref:C3/C5 convertase n=1 Tax=Astyanax mexicanus TaxID=7994 RepID=A0A8T2L996_ASTMX|nr:complement factor B-like [Astyanax mexicanus]